ncbi:unnamed protein product [Cochlearia groenlandica]
MIIKGIFRRYEKWNPVHPTYGAFWGMGVGFGCGVGWGPGFGPEVIGYIGAGCGVGFSVGITLAGFGIGLPTNLLLAAPFNTVEATRKGAFEFFGRNLSVDGFVPKIPRFQRQVGEMCSTPGFDKKKQPRLDNNAINVKSLPLFIPHECGRRYRSHLLLVEHKGMNMVSGQQLGHLVPCTEIVTQKDCVPDQCSFHCALKRHDKGNCITNQDGLRQCLCHYRCIRYPGASGEE